VSDTFFALQEDSTSALNEAVMCGHSVVIPLLVKALSQSVTKVKLLIH